MIWAHWQDLLIFSAAAFGSAFLAMVFFSALDFRAFARARAGRGRADEGTVFLFDEDRLVDATDEAHLFLDAAPRASTDWGRLMAVLSPRFPDIAPTLDDLPELGRILKESRPPGLRLRAELSDGLVRLSLTRTGETEAGIQIDRHSLDAMEHELESLREIAGHTPFLIWRQNDQGQITWVNRAYVDAVERIHGPERASVWPLPVLFDKSSLPSGGADAHRRLPMTRVGEPLGWFECHAAPVGAEVLYTAVDASDAVRAEAKLREFMQTLTKTFAHLTVGLAVFDRARRLALFNPALSDLTGLPADFLSAQPTLFGFLDKLRERRMVPEPKDFGSWRRKIMELEAAAADGRYAEVWSLPDGRTYRVSGRPHPDGAVAFLFEDISAEISLTRRFRSELEVGQGVLDAMEEAIVVFSAGGVLVMANAAYGALWGEDPDTTLADIDVVQACRRWIERTAPTPVWGDLRDFVTRGEDRSEWSADVRLRDGRSLFCRIAPIPGGATLVRFQPGARTARPPLPLSRPA